MKVTFSHLESRPAFHFQQILSERQKLHSGFVSGKLRAKLCVLVVLPWHLPCICSLKLLICCYLGLQNWSQASAQWQFGCLWTLACSLVDVPGEWWQWQVLIPNGKMGAPHFGVHITHIMSQKRVVGAVQGKKALKQRLWNLWGSWLLFHLAESSVFFPAFPRKLSSLEYLDLSSNNLSQIPSGLPRNIVLLHLEKNAIKVIDRDVLTQIKNLEYLLLHNNKLKARGIHPLAFQGLKKLHTVHLYNNMLERIPSGLPRRVKTLMILHNQISEINRNDFATTYFLEELNLSYNKLTSPQIHREAFRKLRQLKSLDLSGNNLHTVPFGFPKNLQVLKLKENEISIIPKGTLSGMTKLRELYLSNNKLKVNSIYSRAWRELSSLQVETSPSLIVLVRCWCPHLSA